VGRSNPFIKPFSLTTIAQFRAPGPPALTSAAYAADVNETKALGSATSTTRTADQTELARFNTESPATLNRDDAHLRDDQPQHRRSRAPDGNRLGHPGRRRQRLLRIQVQPTSPGVLRARSPSTATTTQATVADAAWTAVVATPNHPEYPAAHSCITGAMAEVVSRYYGTPQVTFDINSLTGTTRRYTSTSAWVDRSAGRAHRRRHALPLLDGRTAPRSARASRTGC
jgi:hypothetical protein